MSTKRDIEFHYGEHWVIDFEVKDGDGSTVDITGATIQWRLVDGLGATAMTRVVGDGLAITSGVDGFCTLTVTPAHQTTAAIVEEGNYAYEFRVTTATGTITTNARGAIAVLPTVF
jgi:hypothetical protein